MDYHKIHAYLIMNENLLAKFYSKGDRFVLKLVVGEK